MIHIRRFNENIIDFNTDNVKSFKKELFKELKKKGAGHGYFGPPKGLNLQELKKIGDKYDIEVVDYETFFRELPTKEDQKTAPRKHGGPPAFALVNPTTHKARVVLIAPKVDIGIGEMICHMLTHENIHIQQFAKIKAKKGKLDDYDVAPGSPNDRKKYFSDKKEVMAFSHSIVDMLVNQQGCETFEECIKKLDRNPIWGDIRRSCDKDIQNRYKKYIYQYLKKEFPDEDQKLDKI